MNPSRRAGPTWKPQVCHDCGARHPTPSRDAGRDGAPWRCAGCDAVAAPLPPDDPFRAAPIDPDQPQGSLL